MSAFLKGSSGDPEEKSVPSLEWMWGDAGIPGLTRGLAQQNPLRRQRGHPGKVANVLEREARGEAKARPVLVRQCASDRVVSEVEDDGELIHEHSELVNGLIIGPIGEVERSGEAFR